MVFDPTMYRYSPKSIVQSATQKKTPTKKGTKEKSNKSLKKISAMAKSIMQAFP